MNTSIAEEEVVRLDDSIVILDHVNGNAKRAANEAKAKLIEKVINNGY